jgi:4a-hydroxytetrahydrobiopterin dehydratase
MEKLKILTRKQIDIALLDLPGWQFKDNKIAKEYKFKDFMDCLGFINDLSSYFEEMDHHPDIHIFYSKILFELQRFDIGGKVTDRDIEVAKEIENRYQQRNQR